MAEHVVYVHGRWYDVEKFAHPGGPFALSLGYGRDATVLFESSHPFTCRQQLAALLAKFVLPAARQAELSAKFAKNIARTEFDFNFDSACAELVAAGAVRDGAPGEIPEALKQLPVDTESANATAEDVLNASALDIRPSSVKTSESKASRSSDSESDPRTGATSPASEVSSASEPALGSGASSSDGQSDAGRSGSDAEDFLPIVDEVESSLLSMQHQQHEQLRRGQQRLAAEATAAGPRSPGAGVRRRQPPGAQDGQAAGASALPSVLYSACECNCGANSRCTCGNDASSASSSTSTSASGTSSRAGSPAADHGQAGRPSSSQYATSINRSASPVPLPPADPFQTELLALARDYFTAEAQRRGVSLRDAQKAPPQRWAQLAGLTLLFLTCGAYPLVRGWWPALLIAPSLAWVWMVNFWHDASHFAMSSDWRVNAGLTYAAPWFSSPLIWYHQHVIGHHAYTNVPGKDPDMYHAPRFWRFSDRQRWLPAHSWQSVTTPLLWFVSVPTLLLLKPLVSLRSLMYNRSVPLMALPAWRVALHLLGRAVVFASLYVWPWFTFAGQGWLKPTLFSIVPIGVYSLWFMACSQVNHHHPDTAGQWHANWYRHQVLTSHDVAPGSEVAYWLSGGLNLQIEHHLFPCVNHWHLRQLQPSIRDLAAKHGLRYTASPTIGQAFASLWDHLRDMGQRPAAQLQKGQKDGQPCSVSSKAGRGR